MTELLTQILSQPITQFGAPLALLLLAHKAGILDLRKALRGLILNAVSTPEDSEAQPAIKQLADDMTHLRLHFNDDLTHILTELQVGQREFRTTQLVQCQKLDRLVENTDSMVRDGIRLRR